MLWKSAEISASRVSNYSASRTLREKKLSNLVNALRELFAHVVN